MCVWTWCGLDGNTTGRKLRLSGRILTFDLGAKPCAKRGGGVIVGFFFFSGTVPFPFRGAEAEVRRSCRRFSAQATGSRGMAI